MYQAYARNAERKFKHDPQKEIIAALVVFAVGVCVAWLVTTNAPDGFLRNSGAKNTPELQLARFNDRLILSYGIFPNKKPLGVSETYRSKYGWFGFHYTRYYSIPNIYINGWTIDTPFWFPIIVLLIYPAISFIRGPLRRWRRRRKGLCLNCGYNLTGNTTGICSECGEKT